MKNEEATRVEVVVNLEKMQHLISKMVVWLTLQLANDTSQPTSASRINYVWLLLNHYCKLWSLQAITGCVFRFTRNGLFFLAAAFEFRNQNCILHETIGLRCSCCASWCDFLAIDVLDYLEGIVLLFSIIAITRRPVGPHKGSFFNGMVLNGVTRLSVSDERVQFLFSASSLRVQIVLTSCRWRNSASPEVNLASVNARLLSQDWAVTT